MIFGKTNEERKAERKAFLTKMLEQRERRFAFKPTKLDEGRTVWLGWVYLDYNCQRSHFDPSYISSAFVTYHEKQKEGR